MSFAIQNILGSNKMGLSLFVLCNSPFLLYRIYQAIYPKQLPKIGSVLSKSDDYIVKSKATFLNKGTKHNENNSNSLNTNTSSEFYSKKEYQATIKDEDNHLETEWKRRIMFENTPRGNIIMYYDPYKLAFAYYCDTSSMPYPLLNAAAMKYVTKFHCIDLFVDNEIPLDKVSPLIKCLFTDDEKKKNVDGKSKGNGIDMKNAPFAKLKKKGGTPTMTTSKDTNDAPTATITYHRNKFVCVGKISNYSFINKPKKNVNAINGFNSNLLNNLAAETTLQKKVLSYKDFKNRPTI